MYIRYFEHSILYCILNSSISVDFSLFFLQNKEKLFSLACAFCRDVCFANLFHNNYPLMYYNVSNV